MAEADRFFSPEPSLAPSSIRIDKEGTWFYNGQPIINRAVYLFLNQCLETAADGSLLLRIGKETCPVRVEDTPFVVTEVTLIEQPELPESFFTVRLNDETEERLLVESLTVGKGNVLYCLVKEGVFKARFLRKSYYQLASYIMQEDGGRFYIPLGSKRFYIAAPIPNQTNNNINI